MPIPSLENSYPTASQVSLGEPSCGDESGVTRLAPCGWLVELRLAEREADPRFFAVGTREASDAEEAILLSGYRSGRQEDRLALPFRPGDRVSQTENG